MSYSEAEQFGEAVRILRNRKKLTQEALAKMAFVDTKYLREIEQGKHSVGLELALRLCKALEVNRFELFTLAWEKEYVKYLHEQDKKAVTRGLHVQSTKTKGARCELLLVRGGQRAIIIKIMIFQKIKILYKRDLVMMRQLMYDAL